MLGNFKMASISGKPFACQSMQEKLPVATHPEKLPGAMHPEKLPRAGLMVAGSLYKP